MEHPLGALDVGQHRRFVGNVGLHKVKVWVVAMLFDIGKSSDRKVINDPNPTPNGQQSIDQMAADKPGAPRYDIQSHWHLNRLHRGQVSQSSIDLRRKLMSCCFGAVHTKLQGLSGKSYHQVFMLTHQGRSKCRRGHRSSRLLTVGLDRRR